MTNLYAYLARLPVIEQVAVVCELSSLQRACTWCGRIDDDVDHVCPTSVWEYHIAQAQDVDIEPMACGDQDQFDSYCAWLEDQLAEATRRRDSRCAS